jgi:hypothetical protein
VLSFRPAFPSALLALLFLVLAPLGACSDPEPTPGPPAQTPEELLRLLKVAVDGLAARPEHTASEVTFQHLLVGVAGGVPGVTRTAAEAELLAAGLLARAVAGEDFDLLVKNETDDRHPGIYTLTTGTPEPGRSVARSAMMRGVGDAAWRLAVGELGVAPYDGGQPGHEPVSPLGWHLVLRAR